MEKIFKVSNKTFKVNCEIKDELTISSHPSNYNVKFDDIPNKFNDNDFLLVDKNVSDIYKIKHKNIFLVDANELNKNINTSLLVCKYLIERKFDKSNVLIVIGGGILQDIGAFTSKIFKRGINWIYYPTTLLSQCDSCIGGKTALNFELYKNQLALFSAPSKVIIDINFLKTLKTSDFNSGFGEIVKLFFIGGSFFLNQLNKKTNIKILIYYSLLIKQAIVEYDEFENDIRKSLNYGHTFGHIIEPLSNYNIPHGEAVLLGIYIINKLYNIDDKNLEYLTKFTDLNKLKMFESEKIFKLIFSDKKVFNNKVSFVVVKKPGETIFDDVEIDENLRKKLDEIFIN